MIKPDSDRIMHVLLVEDNPDDVFLTRESLQESHLNIHLHVVEDGVRAMAFLRQQGQYEDAPIPDLVLLDLNMPRMNGHEVLAAMKADPQFRKIPVVVLTTSQAQEDILRAYRLHSNCYVTKPVDLDAYFQVLNRIEEFWFRIANLPSKSVA